MILYSPFKLLSKIDEDILQFSKFDGYSIVVQDDKHFKCYKNGVDNTQEFIDDKGLPISFVGNHTLLKYHDIIPFDLDLKNSEINTRLKNIKTYVKDNKWYIINIPFSSEYLNYIKDSKIYNNVVNPFLLFNELIQQIDNDPFEFQVFIDVISSQLKLKQMGYQYNKLKYDEISLFGRHQTVALDEKLTSIDKKELNYDYLKICQNFYLSNNRKINLMKEFGYDDPLEW
jgi:hypothetical protein